MSINEVEKCLELQFSHRETPTSQPGWETAGEQRSRCLYRGHERQTWLSFSVTGRGLDYSPAISLCPNSNLSRAAGAVWGRLQRRVQRAAPMKPQPGREGLESSQTPTCYCSSTSHSPIISQKRAICLPFKSLLSLSCYKAYSQSLDFNPQSTIWGWRISSQ